MSKFDLSPGSIDRAVDIALARIDAIMIHFMESCVGCAFCRYGCPFCYIDEKYYPVNKAEDLRRMYRRKMSISGRLLPLLVSAGMPSKKEDIERILEFAYSACSNCGACYLSCPFGIDSGVIINVLRTFLNALGATPSPLKELVKLETAGKFLESEGLLKTWEEAIGQVSETIGRDAPLDKQGADVLLLPSLVEAALFPEAVSGAAKILESAGVDWTMPSKPLGVRPPLAVLVGDVWSARCTLRSLDEYIKSIGARDVVILDGGFAYPALRWDAPALLGYTPEYRVLHIVEFLHEALKSRRIKLEQGDEEVTWHNPCQLGRRGGVTKEPSEVMKAVTRNFKPLPHEGAVARCCGSGDAMSFIAPSLGASRIAQLAGVKVELSDEERALVEKVERNFKLAAKRKLDDISATGVRTVVTACPTCIRTIEVTSSAYGTPLKVLHLAEFVAKHL